MTVLNPPRPFPARPRPSHQPPEASHNTRQPLKSPHMIYPRRRPFIAVPGRTGRGSEDLRQIITQNTEVRTKGHWSPDYISTAGRLPLATGLCPPGCAGGALTTSLSCCDYLWWSVTFRHMYKGVLRGPKRQSEAGIPTNYRTMSL
ncbi:hypothetical protein E2C01_046686 [Portunus trituberculatus]|uniref:Uncharacterized protein n=1 Tax=Portunus trituberculatus TaxID=210409 RepID=A0A5B7G5E9_PORTR|nr:hypothetical protein [Portunus trituberculatus]